MNVTLEPLIFRFIIIIIIIIELQFVTSIEIYFNCIYVREKKKNVFTNFVNVCVNYANVLLMQWFFFFWYFFLLNKMLNTRVTMLEIEVKFIFIRKFSNIFAIISQLLSLLIKSTHSKYILAPIYKFYFSLLSCIYYANGPWLSIIKLFLTNFPNSIANKKEQKLLLYR